MSFHTLTSSTLILAFKTITLFLGAIIAYQAFKAYWRTGDKSLQYLSVGFVIITTGSLIAGLLHQLTPCNFQLGIVIESALLTVGLGVILLSLYSRN